MPTHEARLYRRPSETSRAAGRSDDWYELQVLHKHELRDSREYVARLVDFVESLEGGLLKQKCGGYNRDQGQVIRS